MVAQGGDTWFFLTADYAFGHSLEENTTAVVEAAGGQVLGAVRHPFPGQDFSSFLLQAQASGAKVIGLANAGGDTVNAIKQASEFGITQGGQSLAGLLIFITDVHALGPRGRAGAGADRGLLLGPERRHPRLVRALRRASTAASMPTMVHAGVYSSVLHYLKAVEATGSKETDAVDRQDAARPRPPTRSSARARSAPTAGICTTCTCSRSRRRTPPRARGTTTSSSRTIPAAEAFRPLEEGGCPLVN